MDIFGAHDGYINVGIFCVVGYLVCKLLLSWWIWPFLTFLKLRRNGFGGPSPKFPLGNIKEMMEMRRKSSSSSSSSKKATDHQNYASNLMMINNNISHDIHSTLFPYFSHWQKSHGKVFVYWQGTEPFLYIADPEFLQKMSAGVMGKSWGKPTVFKKDRDPLFGNYGLNMVEGDEWLLHRHLITPAFSPTHLKFAARVMTESTKRMIDSWVTRISISSTTAAPGREEVDVLEELIATTGEIIARTSFGVADGSQVLEKLREMQDALFKSNRYVGVPFSSNNLFNYFFPSHTRRLGEEIDALLLSIIRDRIRAKDDGDDDHEESGDLLGFLLGGKTRLPTRQVVDECKTFFFGGHETTALALSWTLLLLAMHPEWQSNLKDEIRHVFGNHDDHQDKLHFSLFPRLKKMEWVMNEVLRMYPSAPNAQRQARKEIIMVNNEDISISIPKGTNMWIDIVAMHHDPNLWGESDVNLFKPERFKEDSLYGGCKHKMGFLPFGFGGRMCIGRNLAILEYKLVLTLLLSSFSFCLSPNYSHSPSTLMSLRPSEGLPLIVQPLF